jgi:hypothetical protein
MGYKPPEKGKRINGMEDLDEKSICFYKTNKGWMLYLPGCGIGTLSKHEITEHDDGMISVRPSILMKGHNDTVRHGYLTYGEWVEC